MQKMDLASFVTIVSDVANLYMIQKLMKKTRPLYKSQGGIHHLTSWILECFPSNYEEMTYCEIFCGPISVLLSKNPSRQEILNDVDPATTKILKALREEPKEFISRVKKISYNERSFAKVQNNKPKDDYLDIAVSEYLLRRMSKNGEKKVFDPDETSWKSMMEHLSEISSRLAETSIFCKHPTEVIKAFDDHDTFFFLNPPPVDKDDILSNKDHIAVFDCITKQKGKFLVCGQPSTLYNRLYVNWTCEKKRISGEKVECLWRNF